LPWNERTHFKNEITPPLGDRKLGFRIWPCNAVGNFLQISLVFEFMTMRTLVQVPISSNNINSDGTCPLPYTLFSVQIGL
jgi:hypothetical protein